MQDPPAYLLVAPFCICKPREEGGRLLAVAEVARAEVSCSSLPCQVQEGLRTGGTTYRRDYVQEGLRTGGTTYRRDYVQEGLRTGGTTYRRDYVQEGLRTGGTTSGTSLAAVVGRKLRSRAVHPLYYTTRHISYVRGSKSSR